MVAASNDSASGEAPPEDLVRELISELGAAFDLKARLGEGSLGEAVASRIRSLTFDGAPEWGIEGSLTQLAKQESEALDFYYRPHLFPGMDRALRLGHHLQFDLLPRQLPEKSPLRLAAVLESYCHLSGDLLGWRLEGDELFVWIADVSGHGVRAGLAAATLYLLIESIEDGLPPGVFAERVNERMLEARNRRDEAALFATAIWIRAGVDGRIAYASAGHNPMILIRPSGDSELLESTGVPLGLLPGQSFGERRFELEEGELLCLFTDGLVEAPSPRGEEFGIDRVVELGCRHSGSPLELTRSIYWAVREHQGTGLFEDDLTFIVAERVAQR